MKTKRNELVMRKYMSKLSKEQNWLCSELRGGHTVALSGLMMLLHVFNCAWNWVLTPKA